MSWVDGSETRYGVPDGYVPSPVGVPGEWLELPVRDDGQIRIRLDEVRVLNVWDEPS